MLRHSLIQQVHIADGFADDCEELIHRWLKSDMYTYETFCEIWKDMHFANLYHGRSTAAEMAELSEELVHIAKHYMISTTTNFQESVAGLFLVYTLVHLQPYTAFACLRVVPEDLPAIHHLETVARREKRYDVLYILGSLLIQGPVQYHVTIRERGMEPTYRKYLDGFTSIDRVGVRPKGVFYRQNEELDIIRELNSITKRYSEAKKAIPGVETTDLHYVKENFAEELDKSLKKIINGIIDDGEEANKMIKDHYNTVQQLKQRAMKQQVDGMRHLQSATDSQDNTKEKRSPSGKIKTSSPKKRLASKRKAKKKKSKAKKRKVSTESSEDTDDDEIDISDENNDNGTDINLNNFDRHVSDIEIEQAEKEIDLQIESLPIFTRTEQDGRLVEIEIIDQTATKDNAKIKEEMNAKNKAKNMVDISLTEIKSTEAMPGPSGVTTSQSNQSVNAKAEKLYIKPVTESFLLKRPLRRDLKQTGLKSKFKRQGMLEVVDFNKDSLVDDD